MLGSLKDSHVSGRTRRFAEVFVLTAGIPIGGASPLWAADNGLVGGEFALHGIVTKTIEPNGATDSRRACCR
jgi:hypothetical protein